MAIEFQLQCRTSVEAARAAIKKGVPEWRESTFPEELIKNGILGIQLISRSDRIVLRYDSGVTKYRWSATNSSEYELTARVVGNADGTCTIQGRSGFRSRPVNVYMPVVIGILLVVSNQPFAASVLFSIAIISYLLDQRRDQNVSYADVCARFLVERVEHVVDTINGDDRT